MTATHAPARCLLSTATLCGASGTRCGDDLSVTCQHCRLILLDRSAT